MPQTKKTIYPSSWIACVSIAGALLIASVLATTLGHHVAGSLLLLVCFTAWFIANWKFRPQPRNNIHTDR